MYGSRICPGQTPDMSSENCLGSSEKSLFNEFWHRTNRIYILCVVHGQVIKKYIYGLKPLES
jgi:hypothetical protein